MKNNAGDEINLGIMITLINPNIFTINKTAFQDTKIPGIIIQPFNIKKKRKECCNMSSLQKYKA